MKKVLFGLVAVVLAIGMVGSAFAYFTDSANSNTNSFSSGTLSIDNNLVAQQTGFTITNMAPGDVTGTYVVTIKNDGTIPLIWAGDWVINGSGLLQKALYINYAKMEFLAPDGVTTWTLADNFITAGLGSGLYPGWFNTLATANTFGLVGLDVWDGNNGMGSTPYEMIGALKPGYSYKLTVKFGMASLADNTYAGQGPVTVVIHADAFQVNRGAIPAALYTNFDQFTVNNGGVGGWFADQLAAQP